MRQRGPGWRAADGLDPRLVVTALRTVFERDAFLEAPTATGFSFRHGLPTRLIGKVWLDEVEGRRVVRHQVQSTTTEQLGSLILMVLGLPTIIVSLFALWNLSSYRQRYVERRVDLALEAARKVQEAR